MTWLSTHWKLPKARELQASYANLSRLEYEKVSSQGALALACVVLHLVASGGRGMGPRLGNETLNVGSRMVTTGIDVEWQNPTVASIHVHGTFDGQAALEVQHALKQRLSSGAELHVDFHLASVIHDFALAMLISWLVTGWQGSIRLIGLGTHQQRLLGYLQPAARHLIAAWLS